MLQDAKRAVADKSGTCCKPGAAVRTLAQVLEQCLLWLGQWVPSLLCTSRYSGSEGRAAGRSLLTLPWLMGEDLSVLQGEKELGMCGRLDL